MDLSKKIQYLTLDIISTVGTSQPFGMLAADSDIDAYIANGEAGLLIGNTFMALRLEGIRQAPLIGKLIAPSPTDASGFGKMLGTCFKIVDARWAEPESEKKTRVDMLASWMRAGLSRDDLRSETVEQILAGSDTTASALRGVFLYLVTNPRVYAKLQREFDAASESGNVEVGETGVITLAATKRMVYLQAVIREAMRVWPPVVNLFPHDVPREGDTVVVDGTSYFLPGGAEIGLSVTGMMHSKAIFGKDAKCFRPERWLEEGDEERLVRMTRTTDLIFGHGRWQCLGKSIAQLEIGKTVYEVLRMFDLALVDPTRPWRTKAPLGLFVINDMWVQVTAR
jgi:cytochrome P450